MEESVNHFFVGCDFFGSLWYLVWQWLGFLSLNLLHVAEHLIQLGNLQGFFKHVRNSIHIIWLSCFWVIWKDINCRIFHNEGLLYQLFDKIKLLSFWW